MTDVRNMRKLIESVNGMSDKDFLREYDENANRAMELEELQDQMLELLGQAENVLQGTSAYDGAKAYWLAHVETALTNDHGYLGGSMTTMQDTIDELRQGDDDDEFEESIDDKAFPENEDDVSACECGSSDISKWKDSDGRTNVACNSCGDEWMY